MRLPDVREITIYRGNTLGLLGMLRILPRIHRTIPGGTAYAA
jgi:hypothetical protein